MRVKIGYMRDRDDRVGKRAYKLTYKKQKDQVQALSRFDTQQLY